MSATKTRPFQVGDRVRIVDYDVMTGQTIRTHTGKIRSLKDMSASDASDWVTCIADVDEPYLMGKSDTLHTVAIVHLVPDRTRSTWPSNQTIELLEPALTNPSDGAVTQPNPAPSDDSTPEEIRDAVLRDVLHSDVMAHLLTTDAFLNASKWRFLQAGLTILAEQGLLSAPEVQS